MGLPSLALVLVPLASPGAPLQLCHSTQSVPPQVGSWTSAVTFPRWDPSAGVLAGVRVELDANSQSSVGLENLDDVPSLVTVQIANQVRVFRPGPGTEIVAASLGQSANHPLPAFDGTLDFGGTSGVMLPAVLLQASSAVTSPPPATDLALFTGPAGNPGTITLPVSAASNSVVGGPGNLASVVQETIGATVRVCYEYHLDCDQDGIPDYLEIQAGAPDLYGVNGGTVVCAPDGVPDSCQPAPDCDNDGLPDACDVVGTSYCLGDGSGTACPCGNQSTTLQQAGCLNSTGSAAALRGCGEASVSADSLVLTCSGLPPTTSALFFQGSATTSAGAGSVFGDGLRCASGVVVRLGTKSAVAGVVAYPGLGNAAISSAGGVPANATRYYQVWYRNVAPFCTASAFNLSQGLQVVWQP